MTAQDRADPEGAIAAAAKRCSNWGRWGADNVRGTMNFLTEDKRLQGAALIRRGVSFSLAQSFDMDGPQKGLAADQPGGGPAPGLSFTTTDWLRRSEIAAIATDAWGVEVRPNEFDEAFQPLHQVAIPQIGLFLGEMWDLDALAADCATDGVYDFT